MRYNLADGELPEDLVTEPVLKVNDKRGGRILSPESCKTDWRNVRIPAICGLCVHPTFRKGIERFSICTLFKQNDIATIFIYQGLDPGVKRSSEIDSSRYCGTYRNSTFMGSRGASGD